MIKYFVLPIAIVTLIISLVFYQAILAFLQVVGVILATLSAIANFAFIPYQPVWSITLIAVNVFVIWALTVHGRDIAEP